MHPCRLIVPLLTALLLVAQLPSASPASASAGSHRVTGTGCHTYVNGYWWPWYWYADADCLTVDAATGGDSLGHATLTGGLIDPIVAVVTLECLEIEHGNDGDHTAFMSGRDASGTPYAITVKTHPSGSGFIAGSPDGGAPCGARDYRWDVDTGSFVTDHLSQTDNELPSPSFTWSCTKLDCSFDASSSYDPDGTITSYRWEFSRYGSELGHASGSTAQFTFPAVGDYTARLTVVDDASGRASKAEWFPVGQRPIAEMTFTCQDLTCTFDGSGSSDPDGSIVRYEWSFGDGTYLYGAESKVTHTFATAGSYYVYLTVIDDDAAYGYDNALVTVPEFTLTARRTSRGKKSHVELRWTGASTSNVRIYRDYSYLTTVSNTGSYSDPLPVQGRDVVYQVCDDMYYYSARCSDWVTLVGG